jgi:hypothetical protein
VADERMDYCGPLSSRARLGKNGGGLVVDVDHRRVLHGCDGFGPELVLEAHVSRAGQRSIVIGFLALRCSCSRCKEVR